MSEVNIIGPDLARNVFRAHGAGADPRRRSTGLRLVLARLRSDCDLQDAVTLVREEIVCRLDIVQLEPMRYQRRQVHAL